MRMRTKSFLFYTTSVVATSLFLILFHSQQPESLQTIVTQTHQQIKNIQNNLKDESECSFVPEEKYLPLLGFDNSNFTWHNLTGPVIVTYVSDSQHAQAIGFIRNMQIKLPKYTIFLYNLGLRKSSLEIISGYCNSSKCIIMEIDMSEFPPHVDDERIHAFRPIIIQHALSRVGGVIFLKCDMRLNITGDVIEALYARVARGSGVVAWPQPSRAVSSLTHRKMFDCFHTSADNFLFLPMLEMGQLIIVETTNVSENVMRPWVLCALTHDCILPIGAQSAGCRFDKKPQYRYSGCHGYDASAFSIILGLIHDQDESSYTIPKSLADAFVEITREEAESEYAALLEPEITESLYTKRTDR